MSAHGVAYRSLGVIGAVFLSQILSTAFAADPPDTAHASSAPSSADFASLVHALKGRWSVLPVGAAADPSRPSTPGEQIWRLGLGGSVLMEEERIPSAQGVGYVLALHWWDNETHSLKGMLCNNSGSGACNVDSYYRSKLTWDRKQFTVNLVFSQGEKMMLWHEVFSDFTPNSFTQTGDIGEVGGPLKRVVTLHATRAASE
jgi:hypothetical protein